MKEMIEVDWLYSLFLSNDFLNKEEGLNKGQMKVVCGIHKNDYFGKWVDLLHEEKIFEIIGYTDNKHPIFSSTTTDIITKLQSIPYYANKAYRVAEFDTVEIILVKKFGKKILKFFKH